VLRADHDLDHGPVLVPRRQEGAKRRLGQRSPGNTSDHIDIAEERRRRLVDRRIVDVVGRALLHDPTRPHQCDLVGHPHRLVRLMRDQKDRGTLFLQKLQGAVADAVAQPVVEARERLVHQHDARLRRQGTRQRDPLLLAARKLMRMLRPEPGKIHLFKKFPNPPRLLGPLDPQPESDIFRDRQMRKQRKILKHQPDRAHFWRHMHPWPRHGHPVQPHLTRIRPLNPGDQPQRGRLATARRPQKASHLPRRDRQRDIIHNPPPPERADNMANLKARGRGFGHGTQANYSGFP
jgi:hypothetical protein